MQLPREGGEEPVWSSTRSELAPLPATMGLLSGDDHSTLYQTPTYDVASEGRSLIVEKPAWIAQH
jgi:hypothetical protein